MPTEDFDFNSYRITPAVTADNIPEPFLRRIFDTAISEEILATTPYIDYEQLRSGVIAFLLACAEGMDEQQAAEPLGIPPFAATNMFAVFILHWDCDVPGCADCSSPVYSAARKKFHTNYNRATVFHDLEAIFQELRPVDFAYFNVESPFGGRPGQPLFDWDSAGEYALQDETDEQLAALAAEVARLSGTSLEELLETVPIPSGVEELLRKGTYPGGPNEVSSAADPDVAAVIEQLTSALNITKPTEDFRS